MATLYIFELSNDKGKEVKLELTKSPQSTWRIVPGVHECFDLPTSGFVEEKKPDDKGPGKLNCNYGGGTIVALNGAKWDDEPKATGGADPNVVKKCMGEWSWELISSTVS